jgi:hypothetical protein
MGASSSPWVERWSSVYTNLSQHGSLKNASGACTPPRGGRDELPHELPSPAHWGGRNSPPLRKANGSDGNVSPGTFSEIKQMLDAAIAAGDAAASNEPDDQIEEETQEEEE